MRTLPAVDYYALLGIDAGADGAKLRRAWRQLALRWHPDRAGVLATATFQQIQAAYRVLSDPAARAAYDRRRGTAHRSVQVEPAAPPRPDAPAVLLRRLSGPLNALLACGVARWDGEEIIELYLRPSERAEGGMVTISMQVPLPCPACGPRETAGCARCQGRRTQDELFSAWLAVPPGVAEGTLLIPSALLEGMRPISFRVRLARPT